MAELGFVEHVPGVVIDVDHPGKRGAVHGVHIWLKEGPVTGRLLDDVGKVEAGSLLFGELRITDADRGDATVRYTLVQLPDGKKYPACIEGKTGGRRPAQAGAVDSPGTCAVWGTRHWEAPW